MTEGTSFENPSAAFNADVAMTSATMAMASQTQFIVPLLFLRKADSTNRPDIRQDASLAGFGLTLAAGIRQAR
ncbi:hypothetical protein GCM10010970_08830 [Silvimonas iriomotensis]|uniref:Uncharacterized protein n=1 Tax=Silvimonas iriomotensis TaxID=449662 RepID=A0ABQ2P680_9NEIS|nr:hypothetical protein GCM10010970_08830 [Silvimonas iriomotensis]